MIITKKHLDRRTAIRGAGVALALPWLDAMVPALAARRAAAPVQRFCAVYIPNGASVKIEMPHGGMFDKWTPTGEGIAFEFSPTLKPLEPFRDRVTVVTGLGSRPAESMGDAGGDHGRALAAWLSASHAKRSENEPFAGTTIDQIAASQFGKDTQLRSLQLAVDDFTLVGNCEQGYACLYKNALSWKSPTEPLPSQINPRIVFERLFGEGGSAENRRAQLGTDRSILDAITKEVAGLQKALGARDRARLAEYLAGVRELEERIVKLEAQQESQLVDLPALPAGVPDAFDDHVKLMYDLQVLGFAADITRVSSFLMGIEGSYRAYPQIGVPDAHHGLSHHGSEVEKLEKQTRINTYHIQLLAYFMEKLRATPDGDGSLLDHTLVLYGSGMSDGNKHNHYPLPLLVAGGAGGRFKGGRHLVYPDHTPMANLLLSVMGLLDVPLNRVGDSTGPLGGI